MKNFKRMVAIFFSLAMILAFIPSMVWADNEVAQIDQKKYASLGAAVEGAKSGDTVKLLSDITYGEDKVVDVWSDKDFNLDLNHHTFTTNSNQSITLSNNGYKASAICYEIDSNAEAGKITISNGNIRTAYGAGIYIDGKYADVTLEGLDVSQNYPNNVQTTDEYSSAVRLTSKAKVTIADGIYHGKNAVAVSSSGGYITINGGKFTGDIFFGRELNSGLTKADKSITINAGTFIGDYVNANTGTLVVKGGYFKENPKDYLESGFEVESLTDGATGDDATAYAAGARYKVVAEPDYVAQIGDTKYATLADAIAAVPNDGTSTGVEMIADSVEPGKITIAEHKNITLDLNGKTVSYSENAQGKNVHFITNTGTLTVTDSGSNGDITFTATPNDTGYSNETVTVYNLDGTLNLQSGMIKNASGGGLAYAVNNSSNAWGKGGDKETVFNMTDGTLSAPNGDAALRVYQNCAQSNDPYSHNTVTISGGTILDTGIFLDNNIYQATAQTTGEGIRTTININGGTINGLIDLKLRHLFNTTLNITGGDFTNAKLRVRKQTDSSHVWNVQDEPTTGHVVTISGGKWNFVNNVSAFNTSSAWTSTSSWTSYKPYYVSGGVFDKDLNNYNGIVFPAGKKGVANTDPVTMGNYQYTVGTAYVAQIGDTKYETLTEAVAAANATTGATIKVLADIDFSTEAYSGYKWSGSTYNPLEITGANTTLDLNGHTISEMGNCAIVVGHILAKYGRVEGITIKNGTLSAGKTGGVTNSYVLGIAGGDNITIKNLTTTGGINVYTGTKDAQIDGCNITGTKYYTVCAQTGSTVVITGTTYDKNTDNTVANKSMFWTQGAGTDSDCITQDNPSGAFDASSITIENGTFRLDRTNGGKFFLGSGLKPVVKGGVYNFDPSSIDGANCVAEGYEAVALTGDKDGWWQVGEIKVSNITKDGSSTSDEAVYTATKKVVDTKTGATLETITAIKVSITTSDTSVTADNILTSYDLDSIVESAIDTSNTSNDNIDVEIEIDSSTVKTGDKSITYEIHPKAIVKVNSNPVGQFIVTNDQLEGLFTLKLTVPNTLVTGSDPHYVKVIHISKDEDYGTDIGTYEVQRNPGSYYINVIVDHFSEFELEEADVSIDGSCKVTSSLTLQDAIKINFYVKDLKQGTSPEDYTVTYSFNGEGAVDKKVSEGEPVETGYRFVVASCAAKEMTDEVSFIVKYKDKEIKNVKYSIRNYCKSKIDANSDEKLVNLCKSVLDYGAYAQLYFDYKTTTLANADGYTAGADTISGVVIPEYLGSSHKDDGVSKITASLNLVSSTELNFYFYNGNIDGNVNVVTSGGSSQYVHAEKTQMADNRIKVTVTGIPAKYLGDTYIVYLGNSYVTYSPMTYAYNHRNDDREMLSKSLYRYFLNAYSYLNS